MYRYSSIYCVTSLQWMEVQQSHSHRGLKTVTVSCVELDVMSELKDEEALMLC